MIVANFGHWFSTMVQEVAVSEDYNESPAHLTLSLSSNTAVPLNLNLCNGLGGKFASKILVNA